MLDSQRTGGAIMSKATYDPRLRKRNSAIRSRSYYELGQRVRYKEEYRRKGRTAEFTVLRQLSENEIHFKEKPGQRFDPKYFELVRR